MYAFELQLIRNENLGCCPNVSSSVRGDLMIVLKLLKIVEAYQVNWVLHG